MFSATRQLTAVTMCLSLAGGAIGLSTALAGDDDDDDDLPTFTNPLNIDNEFLPLSQFTTCELAGEEAGAERRAVKTRLDRTETFTVGDQTVQVVIIEDRAYEDGELVEVALDYYAQDDEGTVHYFGEDVDNYEGGVVVNHDGSFHYGRDTDVLGVAMPDDPEEDDKWVFEDVPDVTKETNKVSDDDEELEIDDVEYEDVLDVKGKVQPDDEVEHKFYAPGIGLIREEGEESQLDLVACS
jgi:hypothetical protein